MLKKISLLGCVFGLACSTAYADPNFHSIALWDIYDPILHGTIAGDFSMSGTVTVPTASTGTNTQQIASTAFVIAQIAASASSNGGSSSGSSSSTDNTAYCALTGCTFSANSSTVSVTPWNYQGWNALAIGGILTFSNGNGTNVGFGYRQNNDGSQAGLAIHSGGLEVGNDLITDTQDRKSVV